ncbi:NACHT domain-containing protein [Kitasatospora sp. NPDC098663]|uniref:NACHT domain-containing protein n=1 Tax=Kitasatospora sp. NPDC098663 TaxID=3364096 RepID=UPI003827FA1E
MSEQTGQYNYERLGEKPFQKLCNALLAQCFPGVRCYPVGHSDGGRDGVLPQDGKPATIFQVKWTSKPLKDPVAWLAGTVKEERANIERLVSSGARQYILLTSLEGTAVPGRGAMDRLDKQLASFSEEFGVEMRVWWRADIDARLDSAPDALKWAYSEMLAGHDLVRYLIEGAQTAAYDHRLRTLVMKVLATQWEEDAKVKFKQAELTSHDLAALFVDVEAVRVAQARATYALREVELRAKSVGGAAKYLLAARQPFTLVRGEPGQGKSTLGQYLCQVHRATFLKRQAGLDDLPEGASPRVPLRVDLKDYVAWLDGGDPLEENLGVTGRRAPRRKASLEEFLAYLLRSRSGRLEADVATVDDITQRLPLLVVLDGLDEVARAETRTLVVKHIDVFTARLQHSLVVPQVVVTTRPNAAALAEPSPEKYETIALSHLKPDLRTAYLRKWAAARSVTGRDRRELERTFHHRSAEPHIDQLADNPMQLTILLYLLHKRGNSVPTNRTELYASYMETFLDREAEKSAQVEEHRKDLEEVTAFLGWLLQAEAEKSSGNGRIVLRKLEHSILAYLFDARKNTELVSALFTAVTDRVWALTSKVQGTFEFDVQPLREYFAARYLYEYAGADQRRFDTSQVLRHLVRRPYWMNVARFYAGFARANELAGLVEALEEEKDTGGRQVLQVLQVLTATWTLLADGVFSGRPRTQQRAAQLLLDDLSVTLLSIQIRDHHELPVLAQDRGGHELAAALLAAVDEDPKSVMASDRIRVASRLLKGSQDFTLWWLPRLREAAGFRGEARWLALGAVARAGEHLTTENVPPLALDTTGAAADAVAAGLAPVAGSATEQRMVAAVLAGHCSDSAPLGKGRAADLLRVLAPQYFLHKAAPSDSNYMFHRAGTHVGSWTSTTQRQTAWQRLLRWDPRLRPVREASKGGLGQRRTTALWANTARAIGTVFGPYWLAAEAAVIGAAAPLDVFVTGGDTVRGSQALGPDADYGLLLQDIRRHRLDSTWWAQQYTDHPDPLSRATWALALMAVADPCVVSDQIGPLDAAIGVLPEDVLRALLASSSRLALNRAVGRRLPQEVLRYVEEVSAPAGLMLAYHDAEQGGVALKGLGETQLAAMARYGHASWPAVSALTARMLRSPSLALLEALRECGPYVSSPHMSARDFPPLTASTAAVFQHMVDHPGEYPREWVWGAQETLAGPFTANGDHSSQPFLTDIAAREEWFSPG